jgi:hypothetical protein
MGAKTVKPVTPLITGATVTSTDTQGTTESIIIQATTAQSSLDFGKLAVTFENYSSTASCVITPLYGDDFSEVSQGSGTALTLGTGATCVFGGKSFESARFLQNDSTNAGKLMFTITTAGTLYVRATMQH